MLELADTTCKPERLVFKGKTTDVFQYKMTLKDSIWFMWINKQVEGPHVISKKESSSSAATQPGLVRKHTHRARSDETVFYAKYSFDLTSMELV